MAEWNPILSNDDRQASEWVWLLQRVRSGFKPVSVPEGRLNVRVRALKRFGLMRPALTAKNGRVAYRGGFGGHRSWVTEDLRITCVGQQVGKRSVHVHYLFQVSGRTVLHLYGTKWSGNDILFLADAAGIPVQVVSNLVGSALQMHRHLKAQMRAEVTEREFSVR